MIIFILAGGFGTRLNSIVSNVPKPMAPILNKPFLEYQISVVRKYFSNSSIYLLTHYKSDIIEEYFIHDKKINIIKENEPLGTGGSIKNALNHICLKKDLQLLILNGDTYIEPNLTDFVNSAKYNVNILASFENNCDRYGTLDIEYDKVTAFKEKQLGIRNSYINAGCYYFKDVKFFDAVDYKNFSIENEFENYLIKKNHIGLYKYQGIFIDIGIPEDYYKMISYIKGIQNGD